jgi:hypothetical protein
MKSILFLSLFLAFVSVLAVAVPAPVPVPAPVIVRAPVPAPIKKECGLFGEGIFCPFTFCGFFGRLLFGKRNC